MKRMDPHKIKKDFPILSRIIDGKPLIYLDNAATTQKPAVVIDRLSHFYQQSNANIHRGIYTLAEETTRYYEDARERVAKFLHLPTANNVIFTKNATESINLVAHAWARKFLREGDEVLITDMEHHSNFVPWYLLAKEKGIKLKSTPLNSNFELDMAAFTSLLTPKVKLVAVTAMSNVMGTITPITEITQLAHKNGSLIAVDGAQATPHLPINLPEINCDFWSFSAHKMLGPTGIGVLWGKPDILDKMDPFLAGGEMIDRVSLEKTTWADPPLKFEAGTPNFADAIAFAEALNYLDAIGMDAIREHEKDLLKYCLSRFSEFPDITIYGPKDPEKQGGVISFNVSHVDAQDIGILLNEEGVSIRVGHHCAQPLIKALHVPSTARLSFYIYNTIEDIDAFFVALKKSESILKSARSR